MEADFGIFEPVFRSAHGYLALLNLGASDATEAVGLVKQCCNGADDPFSDICRLLDDTNWRPHLVAAVAVVICGEDPEVIARLWKRIDRGSWVTPQLGAALFLVDHDFETKSCARLKKGCRIDSTEYISMTGPERHSATGPTGTNERSAKMAATLIQLLQMASPVAGWVEGVKESDGIKELLAQDIDNSASIAKEWLAGIRKIINGQ